VDMNFLRTLQAGIPTGGTVDAFLDRLERGQRETHRKPSAKSCSTNCLARSVRGAQG
jgi:hypothetical protein